MSGWAFVWRLNIGPELDVDENGELRNLSEDTKLLMALADFVVNFMQEDGNVSALGRKIRAGTELD
jgi:hypothetical protein